MPSRGSLLRSSGVHLMSDMGLTEKSMEIDALQYRVVTAGGMLRSARESAGLHIAALAVAMKIPVKKLEALENDRLELLHDAVFVRALASSVCRALKVDPAPVLAKLPLTIAPRLSAVEGSINAPFHKAGDVAGLSFATVFAKPQVLIVLSLLIGVLVVYFFPEMKIAETVADSVVQQPRSLTGNDQTAAAKPDVDVNTVVSVAPMLVPASTGEARTPDVPALVPGKQFASGSALSVVSTPAVVASAASVPLAPGPIAGVIVFRARAASWVKVVDTKGSVLVNKTMAAGEVIPVSGDVPLTVVIGRSDAMDVEVRGKVFSLATVSKENVARFEVK